MTTIAFELDSPYFAVRALREFAENDANWTAMATTLANAIEAAAVQRVIVLDLTRWTDESVAAIPGWLRAKCGDAPSETAVRQIAADIEAAYPDPRVQRVLDVAAETDVDITVEQAKQIADVLLPEKAAPQMSDSYLDALSKEPRGFA